MNVIDQTMIEDNISLFKKGFELNKDFDKEFKEYKQKIEQLRHVKVDREEEL